MKKKRMSKAVYLIIGGAIVVVALSFGVVFQEEVSCDVLLDPGEDIQGAIDAASSGQTVCLNAGIHETEGISIDGKGIHFICLGDLDHENPSCEAATCIFPYEGLEGVPVLSLTNASGFSVENCLFAHSGLYIDKVNGVDISDNLIDIIENAGITIESSSEIHVETNTISETEENAIKVSNSSKIDIRGNHVEFTRLDAAQRTRGEAIEVVDSTNITVESNILERNDSQTGILIHSVQGECRQVEIKENTVYYTRALGFDESAIGGIVIQKCSDVSIEANTIDSSTEKGLWVNSVDGVLKILNNTVTYTFSNRFDELGLGIYISGSFSDDLENVVQSNKVVNSAAFGILFSMNSGFVKAANNIVDDVLIDSLGYGDCMHADSSNSKLAFVNNTLNQCQRIGVYAKGNNDILLLNNLILNSGVGIEQVGSGISWILDEPTKLSLSVRDRLLGDNLRTRTFSGKQNRVKTITRPISSGYNLVWNADGSTQYYQSYTGDTSTDIHEDPLIGADYRISNSSSPAVDAGQNSTFLPDTDFFNEERITGNIVDIGADEY